MSCCTPDGDETLPHPDPAARGDHRVRGGHPIETVQIPGGAFAMGDALGEGYPADGEVPVHEVTLDAFDIDATTVTTAAFAEFVDDTGHLTDAERLGMSPVFAGYASDPGEPIPQTPWWLAVPGADWRHPHGPSSTAIDDHPVVHVSFHDALAYCDWASRALPTEAQWEYAARGGLSGARYPWGDDHPTHDGPTGQHLNIFTGEFPDRPTAPVGTVAARSYTPNGYGLFQPVGNVWEWCADRFSARYYRRSPSHHPQGPDRGNARVLRGGSHLCHISYCYRYRVAARSHNTAHSTAANIGFRTVGAGERSPGHLQAPTIG